MGEPLRVASYAYRLAVLAGCLFLISACGGGGSGSVAPQTAGASGAPVTKPTAGPQGFTPVSFSISLAQGNKASIGRRPTFVPASTNSVAIAVNGTTPQTFPCLATSCSGTFIAPAGGTVNFVFTALDSQQRAVSESSFSEVINANGANTLNVTLEGIVDHATLALSVPGLVSYQSGSATVTAAAYDVDNELIAGTYFVPLTVSVIGDTTGTVAVPAATIATSTSTAMIAYTFSPATQYRENHLTVNQTATTETTPSVPVPFEVGRTFYTFTSANTIVGFTPGATTATRTVPITLQSVANMTCDGSNLYLNDDDDGAGTVYGLAPGATSSPVTYTAGGTVSGPNWVAANGGTAPSTYAQMYVANSNGSNAIISFKGSTAGQPFPLPPDAPVASGGPMTSVGAITVGPTGNVFASRGGATYSGNGGWEVLSPTLAGINGGFNTNGTYDDIIAIDTVSSNTPIYVEGYNATTYTPEIDEYDNFATTPTYISTDSNDTGLFVDSAGFVYTSKMLTGLPPALVRSPGRGNLARRRTLAGTGNSFDVYAPGGLALGAIQYTIPGESLAIDSQNYVYALQDDGSVNIYAPHSAAIVGTIPGTTFGVPSPGVFAFGTFCR